MLTRVFSVYDHKAGYYNVPFLMVHQGEAVRAFADLANDLSTSVGRHPGDFRLYEIGSFDALTGTLSPLRPFVDLGLATSFVRVPAQTPLPLPSVLQERAFPVETVGVPGAHLRDGSEALPGRANGMFPGDTPGHE